MMIVKLLEHPTDNDWIEVKRRAMITAGKVNFKDPKDEWKKAILKARHSPIRRLQFSFYIKCPYWVSVHLCRHVHTQPYVQSQRNDRQFMYDRNEARQDEEVEMIWDMNAEALINVANKRLCRKASYETREVVKEMCRLVIKENPEFSEELVPMCVRETVCHEMKSCKEK